MTWEAAMRWAGRRFRDDGRKRRVYGYVTPVGRWAYAVGNADPWADAWPGGAV